MELKAPFDFRTNCDYYRPALDELAPELVQRGSVSVLSPAQLDPEFTRAFTVIEPAKLLGLYSLQRVSQSRFDLVCLVVVESFEAQTLGRRLLGHAIGLAESKGGRDVHLQICADNIRALNMLQRYGFERSAREQSSDVVHLRFEMVPE